MIVIIFFFLLRPGEYTGTTIDNAPFRLQDVHIYIGGRKLDIRTASLAELDAATSVSYKFTTQNNGIRDEKLVQGRSSSGLCCPIKATVRRIKHHRLHKSNQTFRLHILSHQSAHRHQTQGHKGCTSPGYDSKISPNGSACIRNQRPVLARRQGHGNAIRKNRHQLHPHDGPMAQRCHDTIFTRASTTHHRPLRCRYVQQRYIYLPTRQNRPHH
jgi:hypothetical protein